MAASMKARLGKEKWVKPSSAAQPVSEVARQALLPRLESAWQFFLHAATEPEKDVEYVHQARVWSRRSIAALSFFRDVLPKRKRKSAAKRLKQMRRAAGDARDNDVLAARLAALANRPDHPDAGAACLLAKVQADRAAAQQPLIELSARLERKGLAARLTRLAERARWRAKGAEPDFRRFCHARLRSAARRFFKKTRGDLSNTPALHALRIEAKRLRYTMELCAAAYPAAFRKQLYPQIEQLQERLGEVNDHAAAGQRFRCWHDASADADVRATLRALMRQEEESLAAARQGLLAWWTVGRAEKLRASLEGLLCG